MSRQGELFGPTDLPGSGPAVAPAGPPLECEQLLAWQARLAAHQGPLFHSASGDGGNDGRQGLLFALAGGGPAGPGAGTASAEELAWRFDPLRLQPQSLSFWRWPEAPHQGAALYLVMDRPPAPAPPLLLYVGETGNADRRWKGDHDCKSYLAAYSEALTAAGLTPSLSIRFWCDVPSAVRPRRALEQALIRRWLPPFNKETRDRWSTPFTAEPG
jgi:hypothetical protein